MADMIELVTVAADGTVEKTEVINAPEIYVVSEEIIPKGYKRGSHAYIIDKKKIAVCDGNNNWYCEADKPGAAGQPWSVLL